MSDRIEIQPVERPIEGRVRPPGSKSITNRALVCAALADGASRLVGALASEDTDVMIRALGLLGIRATRSGPAVVEVAGCGGRIDAQAAELDVANSGTTMRFLTAALATFASGRFRIAGVDRMHQRPIEDLVAALNQLGANVACERDNGCPPVLIHARGLEGGTAVVRGDISSQFLSGLLMAAPYARRGVRLDVDGPLVSQPYVDMTRRVMQAFGVEVRSSAGRHFEVDAHQHYRGRTYAIEPDASAASYFWGAAAVTGGRVTVEGLGRTSLQGDVAFCECLRQMGCRVDDDDGRPAATGVPSITVTGGPLVGISTDMNAISDTVPTLAAVALFADGPTTIHGVAHIRHKETDRIGDLARELRRVGAEIVERDDGLTITPMPLGPAEIETYRDHRMAMAMSLVGLRVPGIVIKDPECTSKTYPGFFDDLARLIAAGSGS